MIEQIGASLISSAIGGMLGGGGGTGMSRAAIEEANRRAKEASFKPYTVTTSTGTTGYDPTVGFVTALSDPLQNILGTSLTGAGQLFQRAATFDPNQRSQEVFSEQAALLAPEFAKQETRLRQGLLGSGRLGLRLAGEGVGAGSGMVQPDVFGLGQAQQQTLADIAAGSREQAMREQAQLQALSEGLLGAGLSIGEAERALMAQGLDAETARAAAAYGAGNLALNPYASAIQAQSQNQANRMGLYGGLLSGAGRTSSYGGGLFSGGFRSGLDDVLKLFGGGGGGNRAMTGTYFPNSGLGGIS